MVKVRRSRVAPPRPECPLARCMQLINGAWAPHVIWFLGGGPRRFGELKGDIQGISAKMLSARLRQLARDGAVRRSVMRTSPPTVEYALTDLGAELVPAIRAIVSVGDRLKEQERASRK